MRFAAPWDRALKASTAVAALALAAVLVTLGAILEGLGLPTGAALVAATVPATLALAWAFAPRAYAIEGGRLRVERPLFPVEVPLARILAAGPLPDESFRGAIKVAGSSGLFGYYGRFWNGRLGAFRLYATRRTGLVVVDTSDERFVLSPEPRDRFLDAVLERAPSASRAPGEAPVARRPIPRRVYLGAALLVAAIPLAIGIVELGTWAYAPQAAVVEGGEIRVQRRAGPALVVPLSEVRRVERLAPDRARFARVAGVSQGALRYGRFRSPDLGEVRLYAWRAGPYVLLETAAGPVVLTPDDADAFVVAVQAALPR